MLTPKEVKSYPTPVPEEFKKILKDGDEVKLEKKNRIKVFNVWVYKENNYKDLPIDFSNVKDSIQKLVFDKGYPCVDHIPRYAYNVYNWEWKGTPFEWSELYLTKKQYEEYYKRLMSLYKTPEEYIQEIEMMKQDILKIELLEEKLSVCEHEIKEKDEEISLLKNEIEQYKNDLSSDMSYLRKLRKEDEYKRDMEQKEINRINSMEYKPYVYKRDSYGAERARLEKNLQEEGM